MTLKAYVKQVREDGKIDLILQKPGQGKVEDFAATLLDYIREQDLWLYHKLRYSILGRAANLPGRGGRKMFVAAYKICQKFYGFN